MPIVLSTSETVFCLMFERGTASVCRPGSLPRKAPLEKKSDADSLPQSIPRTGSGAHFSPPVCL